MSVEYNGVTYNGKTVYRCGSYGFREVPFVPLDECGHPHNYLNGYQCVNCGQLLVASADADRTQKGRAMTTLEDDWTFQRALKFANDCGSEALGGRDFDKIKQFYIDFATDIATHNKDLIAEQVQKARIDEAERAENYTGDQGFFDDRIALLSKGEQ